MFNIKKMLEDNGHEVIPFSIHSNKNVATEYSKYFVEPIGGRDATYFDEVKKTPKSIWQLLTRSIYSREVEKAIKKEIKDVKPDLVYIIHFVNKLSPSVITGASKMGIPVVLRLSDYFLLCPRFDFMYEKKVCEECLSKGYRSCIKKRCVKGSLFASVVRVFSMKFHKMINVYKNVYAFITPSEFLKKKLALNGFDEKRIHCIPTFTASKTTIGEPQIGSYGLYFGRVTEEKGVETVIKAYEKLPEYTVKIMGDDTTDEAKRLKKYVKDHKMKNVEFLGFKSGEELEDIIKGTQNEKLMHYVQDYQIHLIDPAKLTEEDLKKFTSSLREVIEYIKYSKDKEKLSRILKDNSRMLIDREAALVIKTITNTAIEISEKEEKIDMCKAIDDMLSEREAKGEIRGIEIGEFRMLVKQVKKGRLTIEEAAEDAAMSVEEFRNVTDDMLKEG